MEGGGGTFIFKWGGGNQFMFMIYRYGGISHLISDFKELSIVPVGIYL